MKILTEHFKYTILKRLVDRVLRDIRLKDLSFKLHEMEGMVSGQPNIAFYQVNLEATRTTDNRTTSLVVRSATYNVLKDDKYGRKYDVLYLLLSDVFIHCLTRLFTERVG